MEVIVRPDASQAIALVAALLETRLRAQPALVLGLATGRTMERVYGALVESGVSFRGVTSFNLDEYIGLAPNDPSSYRHYMEKHLFSRVDIDPARTHVPDGIATDLVCAAEDYERCIRDAGGIDVQLLGIGVDGHIGFNEPLSSLMSRTRDKCLAPVTRVQNAPMFGDDPERVPERALTMGVGTILEARELILLATGNAKATIVARAVEGSVSAMVSASALQLHPNCKVIVDEAAGGDLEGREYYDFVYANEPSWGSYRERFGD